MNRFLIFLAVLIFSAGSSYAQETTADDLSGWANEWKYAFSKEGVKEWKPEFTLRYYSGLTTSGPMLTGGVKVDEKRTFAMFVGQGDTYLDYAPGDLYFISTGLSFRRYWHLGKRKIFAFYSDLYAGAGGYTRSVASITEMQKQGNSGKLLMTTSVMYCLSVDGSLALGSDVTRTFTSSSGQPLRQIVLEFI